MTVMKLCNIFISIVAEDIEEINFALFVKPWNNLLYVPERAQEKNV